MRGWEGESFFTRSPTHQVQREGVASAHVLSLVEHFVAAKNMCRYWQVRPRMIQLCGEGSRSESPRVRGLLLAWMCKDSDVDGIKSSGPGSTDVSGSATARFKVVRDVSSDGLGTRGRRHCWWQNAASKKNGESPSTAETDWPMLKDRPVLGWQSTEGSGTGHFVLDLITSYPMKDEDVMAADSEESSSCNSDCWCRR